MLIAYSEKIIKIFYKMSIDIDQQYFINILTSVYNYK